MTAVRPLRVAVLALLSLLACAEDPVQNGELRIIEAGPHGRRGPLLTDGMCFCPLTFSKRGFSVVCIPDPPASAPVYFRVDNRLVRRELYAPYTVAGDDRRGAVLPWISFASSGSISCHSKGELIASARIRIGCTKATPPPERTAVAVPDKPIVQTQEPGRTAVAVPHKPASQTKAPGGTAVAGTVKPSLSPAPPQLSLTPESTPSTAPARRAAVLPLARDPTPARRPSYLTRDVKVSPAATGHACVVLRGDSFLPPASAGWETNADGSVVFRRDDESFDIVKAGKSPLRYSFIPPVTGRYGITLDMETKGFTEHNDVWVKVPGGIVLRLGRKGFIANRYVKAFHGKEGRAVGAFAEDIERLSMSTAKVLTRGFPYEIVIAGRSTKVAIHRVIMFPCEGVECQYRSQVWKDSVERCSKNST